MNNPSAKSSGCKFGQTLVNQEPVYDKKLKIKRPRKIRKSERYIK